ncbi:MAG: hypothetical protein GTO67_11450 [Gammaproteobacteria bacterium]|nr:hypothetical protein [Gammaproteobacteria bacterium]NIM74788.1 hypothetical protein [Gammaproteobacteria bacterium]NIN39219.1 hypothetical protein [Gammaproteobacteria bacterium]NIO26705.1 hypothetical protein [Gammaproteobacteria bacterium]NIO67261.1 hypothetical protein [Gammaproteobacteria bacterium]
MVSSLCARAAAALLFASSMLMAGPALAQWRVAQDRPSGSSQRIDVAVVENESGHRLRFYSDDTENVRALFTIRGGFDSMDPGACPTYRIDNRDPRRVTFEEQRCRILPKQVEFTLGKTGLNQNRELKRIMNGNNLVVRYRLGSGIYRETQFTLSGSKYALTLAVRDREVGGDE